MRRSLPIHSSRLFSTSSSTTRGNVLSKYARRPLPDFPAPSLPPPTTQSTQSPTPSATSPLSPALSLASDTQSSSVQPLSTSSKPVAATAEGEPTKPFTRAVFIPETVPTGEREKRGPEDDAFEVCGVKVPEKPWKPGEEDCCMSGCVHCIYDIYSTSLADHSSALACALDALRSSQTPRAAWPLAVKKFDEKGGEEGGAKELLQDMDPTMRAFLEMEGRLKKTAEVAQDGKKG